MNDPRSQYQSSAASQNSTASNLDAIVEKVWNAQVQGWEMGSIAPAEEYFQQYPVLVEQKQFAIDVVFNEFALRSKLVGAKPEAREFYQRFPQLMPSLQKQLDLFLALDEQLDDPDLDLADTAKFAGDATVDDENKFPPDSSMGSVGPGLPARYQIRKELGSGASSMVYEAWDDHLKQTVAIKKPHPSSQNSPHARRRLIQEARAVSKLHHPRIVSVREINTAPSQLYLVSPLIKGQSLAERMLESKPKLEVSVKWIEQLAEALHYAHENGVVHRDVKPANIVIDHNESPVLTDFGLATNQDFHQSITHSGDLVGTPAYMSPEQVLSPSETGPCSDIYSLGATFYQLLSGQLPFSGSFSKVIHQVLEQPAPRLRQLDRNIPRELDAIVGKCLEKDPQDRYSSAQELADDLRRFQNGESIRAASPQLHQKFLKLLRRHPIASTGIGIATCLVAFLLGTLWQLNEVVEQRDRAVAAENSNQNLLAAASLDAADSARQQGKFSEAIGHYRKSLELNDAHSPETKFQLVECLVAAGKAKDARQVLAEIKNGLVGLQAQAGVRGENDKRLLATVDYWNWELTAIGDDEGALVSLDENKLRYLSVAKREFILGMQAVRSTVALRHFQKAVAADPYHHGARRMSMIMALSLAQHDDVIKQAATARLLFPSDVDMALMEALARAGNNELQQAELIVAGVDFSEQEREHWIELCQFVNFLAKPMPGRINLPTDLQVVTMLTKSFLNDYLSLLEKRNWRFPPAIGSKFVAMPQMLRRKPSLEALDIARELATIHPEGSLVTVAAEMELANEESGETVERLQRSLEWHSKALKCSSFLDAHHENARLGVYANAVALALVHNHEVDANTLRYVEACKSMNPNSAKLKPHCRTLTISLVRANEWALAGEYAETWFKSSAEGSDRLEALWHQALVFKNGEKWSDVLRCCQQAKQYAAAHKIELGQQDWTGLGNCSKDEFQKLTTNADLNPMEN